MEGKQIWMTIIVALVVAAVTSLVTGAIAKDVLLAPYTTTIGQGGPIKANSCDADNICEVNQVSGQVGFFDSVEANDLDVNGATHLKDTLRVEKDSQMIGMLSVSGPIVASIIDASEEVDIDGDLEVSNVATFHSLNGNGTGYACLDSAGNLFRKQTPCV
ncbi:hypothetical protein HY450_01350 [Candidatus Pacearchaeota archaeon]|nr:hypothetical protein [Candidatus Pacearchaeota archaeon]